MSRVIESTTHARTPRNISEQFILMYKCATWYLMIYNDISEKRIQISIYTNIDAFYCKITMLQIRIYPSRIGAHEKRMFMCLPRSVRLPEVSGRPCLCRHRQGQRCLPMRHWLRGRDGPTPQGGLSRGRVHTAPRHSSSGRCIDIRKG